MCIWQLVMYVTLYLQGVFYQYRKLWILHRNEFYYQHRYIKNSKTINFQLKNRTSGYIFTSIVGSKDEPYFNPPRTIVNIGNNGLLQAFSKTGERCYSQHNTDARLNKKYSRHPQKHCRSVELNLCELWPSLTGQLLMNQTYCRWCTEQIQKASF